MKNTQASYYFLINSLHIGGAERVVVNLANGLVEEGHKVTILTLFNGSDYDIHSRVIRISLLYTDKYYPRLLVVCYPYFWLRLLFHFFTNSYTGGMSFLEPANILHILTKRQAIVSFRTSFLHFKGLLGKIYLSLIVRLYRYAGKIVVNSEENKQAMNRKIIHGNQKIEVLYNLIDKEDISVLKNKSIPYEIKNKIMNKKAFITVGRLILSKRHHKILVRLEAWYKDSHEDFAYLIVGDGPEKNRLMLFVATLDIRDKVVFLGNTKNVFSYLQQSDVFLFASEYEGFPNVLLEALAVGLPIITTDFSTGGREVMLGRYFHEEVSYPLKTSVGYLVSQDMSLVDFKHCLQGIDTIHIPTTYLDKYTPKYAILHAKKIMNKKYE